MKSLKPIDIIGGGESCLVYVHCPISLRGERHLVFHTFPFDPEFPSDISQQDETSKAWSGKQLPK